MVLLRSKCSRLTVLEEMEGNDEIQSPFTMLSN